MADRSWPFEGATIVGALENAVLLRLQFYGVLLMFIAGVGLRTLPVFFGARRPARSAALATFALTQAGLVLSVGAAAVDAFGGERYERVEDAGLVLLGAGLALSAWLMGWWRRPSRLRPASRQFAVLLQVAMAWQTVAALLLVALGALAFVDGSTPIRADLDATRHLVGIGVVLSMIVGMAQLVLPEFAGERLVQRQGSWRGIAFAAALSAAAALRAGARLFDEQLPDRWDHWLMAVAGMLAFVVIAAFAVLFVRSVRRYGNVLEVAADRAAQSSSEQVEGSRMAGRE